MIFARKPFLAIYCIMSGAYALAAAQSRQTIEDDIHALYQSNDEVRQEAAQRLVARGSKAVPLLIGVLCNESKPHFDLAWPIAANALGELKAEAAAPCLVRMLGRNYPPIGSPFAKTDETLRNVDPAFRALVQIGPPAVPAIRSHLALLHPEYSLMAVRVLRLINTPEAKEAAEAYINFLEDQIRCTKQVVADFGKDRDSYSE
jgi:HEAT repeat protein